MGKIKWPKIIANAGEAFFVTLCGILTFNALKNLKMELGEFLLIAVIPAAIQFGLSFFREWSREEEESINPGKAKKQSVTKRKVHEFLRYLVYRE